MKRFLPSLFLLWTLGTLSVLGANRPNILLFLVDDLGVMDTSVPFLTNAKNEPVRHPLNSWFRTPNLERLASRGTRFSDFYAHTVCSPTRVSLMTGQNSARHRVTNFIGPDARNTGKDGAREWRWEGLKKGDLTLPHLLKQAGYQTIHVGKAHFGPVGYEGENPTNLGFDVNIAGCAYGQPGSYYGEDGYGNLNPKRQKRAVPGLAHYHKTDTFLSEALTLEAKKAIDQSLLDEKPFFLYLSHYAVHSPFNPDKRFIHHYRQAGKSQSASAFAALVEGIDKSLGDMLHHLNARGIAKDTVVFFLGDNGSASPLGNNNNIGSSAPLRGKKGTKWEGGIRVPFVASWAKNDHTHQWQQRFPIQVKAHQKAIGRCYDLFPTLLKLAQLQPPSSHAVDGHDLWPLLAGKEDPHRPNRFLSHFPHPRSDNHFTTFRENDWKLIYHYRPETNQRTSPFELYNLATDPSESEDLSQVHPHRLRQLMKAMSAQLKSMNALYSYKEGTMLQPVVP